MFGVDYQYANTRVFWDMVDFPIPAGGKVSSLYWNITRALETEFFQGELTIFVYAGPEKDSDAVEEVWAADLLVILEEEKDVRLSRMIRDMAAWACSRPTKQDDPTCDQTNVMVITKDLTQEWTPFFSVLDELQKKGYNIFLVIPDDGQVVTTDSSYTKEELLDIPLLVWRWGNLCAGGSAENLRDYERELPICPEVQVGKRHHSESDSQDVIRHQADADSDNC